MTIILHELPYSDAVSDVTVDHQLVQVLPHQIIVWVSVRVRDLFPLPAPFRRFPAILDTGNNYGFAISEKHLRRAVFL